MRVSSSEWIVADEGYDTFSYYTFLTAAGMDAFEWKFWSTIGFAFFYICDLKFSFFMARYWQKGFYLNF
jgi:hypothetical protein